MEKKDDLTGTLARLPNDELVRIESIEGTSALVRRVEGPREGTLAICELDKLLPA